MVGESQKAARSIKIPGFPGTREKSILMLDFYGNIELRMSLTERSFQPTFMPLSPLWLDIRERTNRTSGTSYLNAKSQSRNRKKLWVWLSTEDDTEMFLRMLEWTVSWQLTTVFEVRRNCLGQLNVNLPLT